MFHRVIKTFTGPFLVIQLDDRSLRTSWLTREVERQLTSSRESRSLAADLVQRLRQYFEGDASVDFEDVALPGAGGEFQRRCWRACRRIPRGEARTYAQLAAMAGSPAAARAAGQAMRHNVLPIIVPCHRVIGSGGHLHGFGGTTKQHSEPLAIKRALLEMEGALADDALPGMSVERSARRTQVLATA